MEDDQEKTEEPSQYRIEEFRSKGMVAASKEIVNVFVLSGTLLALIVSSLYLLETLSQYFVWILGLYPEAAFTDKIFKMIIWESLHTLGKSVIPVFGAAASLGVLTYMMQIGFIFSTEVLTVKIERINPVEGLKRIFSLRSLVEVAKSLMKFLIIIAISYFVLRGEFRKFSGFLQMDFTESFHMGKILMVKLTVSILSGLLFIALGDLIYEKYSYRKKLLQTRQQLKEETKEKEGNPEIKQRIRNIQREMANKRMMADIPKADVIITNPTHYSVAIMYDSKSMIAPVVVGKGVDHLALKIREIAKIHNVPLVENKGLARTLYKTVKIGEAVPRSLYKAVAEILAFVFKLKRKGKVKGG